jgi:hypothetical protein
VVVILTMLQYTALTARSVLTQNEAEEALSKKRQGSVVNRDPVWCVEEAYNGVGCTRRRSRGTNGKGNTRQVDGQHAEAEPGH